jgi:hypothetical protein
MEDFVTFETAVKLKKKGFPQSPNSISYSSYYDWDGLRKIHPLYNALIWFDSENKDNLYFAPIISQVLKWLREVHHLHFEIIAMVYGYNISIVKTPDIPNEASNELYNGFNSNDGPNNAGAWDNYESCVLFGIEYVIDNLI